MSLSVIRGYFELTWKELKAYRSTLPMLLVNITANIAIWVFFWYVVGTQSSLTKIFSFYDLVLLTGFAQLYSGIFGLMFVGVLLISDLIIEGEIDKYLTYPIRILYPLLGEHFRGWGIPYIILGLLTVLWYFVINFSTIFIPNLIIGILLSIVGIVIINEIYSTLGVAGFFLNRMSSIIEFMSEFDSLAEFPLNHPNKTLKNFITFVVPFYLVSTAPVLLITNKISIWAGLYLLLVAIIIMILWGMLIYFLWNKGREVYNSAGG